MADSVGKGFPTTSLQRGHIFCDLDDFSHWKYLGGEPRNVSSWMLVNGVFQTQPDTSQWGINQAGAMWFYAPEQSYYGWDGETLVMMAFVGGENLYRYQNTIMLQDDFSFGGNSSGITGNLGWTLGAGSIAGQASEANAPGIFRLGTTAVSGTIGRLLFNATAVFPLSFPQETISICRLNTNDANTTVRIGYVNSSGANPPNHGVYFEKLDADVDWFCVTRAASVETRVDSNINVNTSFNKFRITRTTTGVQFYVNEQFVTEIPTNIPTIDVAPCYQIVNSAAADKTLDIDYFQLVITGLTR